MAASSSSVSPLPTYTPFADLVEGADLAIKALVCRSWDVKNPSGKYIGTEYILSDESGDALHCIARSSIAHCVVSKLHVGCIFSIRRFSVAPNKGTYRLRRSDTQLINLESNTVIQKLECPAVGFTRHPFILESLEAIVFNNHAFLIDVVGRPVNVGSCKPTRNGSVYLDLELMNERGCCSKVTLWGALGEELIGAIATEQDVAVVLLPAMNIREYKGELHLSSTSGTQVFVSDDIPEIANLKELMRNCPAQVQRTYGTLLQVLQAGRAQVGVNNVQSLTTVCKVKVVGIRPRTPWNYYSCREKGCKKGVTPVGSQFWCESCEKICAFPLVRYLLRLEVSDESTCLAVTVFDEIAETMIKKSASAVLADMQGRGDEIEYPAEIHSLLGTHQVLELKSHTYYNHGPYESFTVSRVLTTDKDRDVLAGCNDQGSWGNTSPVGVVSVHSGTVAAPGLLDNTSVAHSETAVKPLVDGPIKLGSNECATQSNACVGASVNWEHKETTSVAAAMHSKSCKRKYGEEAT